MFHNGSKQIITGRLGGSQQCRSFTYSGLPLVSSLPTVANRLQLGLLQSLSPFNCTQCVTHFNWFSFYSNFSDETRMIRVGSSRRLTLAERIFICGSLERERRSKRKTITKFQDRRTASSKNASEIFLTLRTWRKRRGSDAA